MGFIRNPILIIVSSLFLISQPVTAFPGEALRPLAASENGRSLTAFPNPVWIQEHPFAADNTQSSYLNRHLAEKEQIEAALPALVQKNLKTRTITIGLLGTSTGEEIARAWSWVAEWLEKNGHALRGEPAARWGIEMRCVDVDTRLMQEAKARLNGESPFAYAIYESDRQNKPGLEDEIRNFSRNISARVQKDSDLIKGAVEWIHGGMSDPSVLRQLIAGRGQAKEPDIIICNIASEYLPGKERTRLWSTLAKTGACIVTTDPFLRNEDKKTNVITPDKLPPVELSRVTGSIYYVRFPMVTAQDPLSKADMLADIGMFPEALNKYYEAAWQHRNKDPQAEARARQSYVETWRRLAGANDPRAFNGEFAKFAHSERASFKFEIAPVMVQILGQASLTGRQMAELDKFLAAIKAVEAGKKKFQGTDRWPTKCHIYGERIADILEAAGVKNVRYRERQMPFSPHPLEIYKDSADTSRIYPCPVAFHAHIICEVAGVDFIVDISADQFEIYEITDNDKDFDGITFTRHFEDLGVVAVPKALVEASPVSRRNFWFYTTGVQVDFFTPVETGDHFYSYIPVASNVPRAQKPIPADVDAAARAIRHNGQQLPATGYWLFSRYAMGNLTSREAATQVSDLFGIDAAQAAGYVAAIPRHFLPLRELAQGAEAAKAMSTMVSGTI